MGLQAIETDKGKRKGWLSKLADELLKTEAFFPMCNPLDGDYPPWVQKLEGELGKAMFPLADCKQIACRSDVTPKRMGALIGHSCAMAVWTMEWLRSQGAIEAAARARTNDVQ